MATAAGPGWETALAGLQVSQSAGLGAVRALLGCGSVEGLWLVGSIGRGEQDAVSDVDIVVTIDEAARPDVGEMLRDALEPVIFLERHFATSGLYNLVAPDWGRVDVSVYPLGAELPYPRDAAVAVRDTDHVRWNVGRERDRGASPTAITLELMRVLGLVEVVLAREQLWTAMLGCCELLRRLGDLLGALSGSDAAVAGALSARRQPPDRLQPILSRLPGFTHDRESILDFHVAAWRATCELLRDSHALAPELRHAQKALTGLYRDRLDRPIVELDATAYAT